MYKRAWYISQKIDLKALEEAVNIIKNAENLISMSKRGEYLREDVDLREFSYKYDGFLLEFNISASHFLRYMVRKIVGHVIHTAIGRIDVKTLKKIIDSKDPTKALFLAPPEGLYLKEVYYLPEDEEL